MSRETEGCPTGGVIYRSSMQGQLPPRVLCNLVEFSFVTTRTSILEVVTYIDRKTERTPSNQKERTPSNQKEDDRT